MKTYRTSSRPRLKTCDASGSLQVPQKQRIKPRTTAQNGDVRIVRAASNVAVPTKGNLRKEIAMR